VTTANGGAWLKVSICLAMMLCGETGYLINQIIDTASYAQNRQAIDMQLKTNTANIASVTAVQAEIQVSLTRQQDEISSQQKEFDLLMDGRKTR
jgi:hypothetical protein